MGTDDNGQIDLFGNDHTTLEAGDQFADGDGDTYTIVSMTTKLAGKSSSRLMVKMTKSPKWAEVVFVAKSTPDKDWEKEMSEFVNENQLIKLENKEDD